MAKPKQFRWTDKKKQQLTNAIETVLMKEPIYAAVAQRILSYRHEVEVFLKDFISDLERELSECITLLAKSPIKGVFAPQSLSTTAASMFGGIWGDHALNCPPLLWHKPCSEPDITKLMSLLMGEHSEYGKAFRQSFLCAVADLCADTSRRFVPPKDVFVTVKAEAPAGDKISKGRIDLFFQWGAGDAARVVIVEVKFKASIDNPCKAYVHTARQELVKASGNCENGLLAIFLVQRADAKTCENGRWQTIFWQTLIPLWERYLQKIIGDLGQDVVDEKEQWSQRNCSALRRTIVNKVYGV